MAQSARLPQVLAVVAVVAIVAVTELVVQPSTGTPEIRLEGTGHPSAYSEGTVRLPGFDPLYGYVYGSNCVPGFSGCYLGGSDYSQVPVLSNSPEQPFGIYYIDNASDLVEYQIPSGALRVVAHVTLLYQTYAYYGGMLANEFFLPYGLDEALFFGTLLPYSYEVSVETVNLTTGAVRLLTTSIPIADTNQQPILVSPDALLVVSSYAGGCVECSALVVGVDLATGREWLAGTLPFFEANNAYWVSQKRELINVEAHGATGDEVQQWNTSVNGEGNLSLSLAATTAVDDNVAVNWVDGVGYNATANELAYSAGGPTLAATYVLAYGADGLLSNATERRYVFEENGTTTGAQAFSGQQYVYTSDWVVGGFYNGSQYLFDPWDGSTAPTNEPFTDLVGFDVCDATCFLGTYAGSVDVLIDFHASVARNDPFWSVVVAIPANDAAAWP